MNELKKLNDSLKTNIGKNALYNALILALIFSFFLFGFNFTKQSFFDFIDLSWSRIFPNLLDLGTLVLGLISIKGFYKIVRSDDFIFDGQDSNKFLKNKKEEKLFFYVKSLLFLNLFNLLLAHLMGCITDKFSTLNELYFSHYYEHLPLFPLNILLLAVTFVWFMPTTKMYMEYKKEIAKLYQDKTDKSTREQFQDFSLCLVLMKSLVIFICIFFCIGMSLLKQANSGIYSYFAPVGSRSELDVKFDFCPKASFETRHEKDILVVTDFKVAYDSQGNPYNKKTTNDFIITPELKEEIINSCPQTLLTK